MIAIAVSGNLDQRPDTSRRMPQARATSASRKLMLMTPPCACSPPERAGSMPTPAGSVADRGEKPVKGGEACVEDGRRPAEPDAQMALGLEVDARDDHGRVVADEAIDQRHRVD